MKEDKRLIFIDGARGTAMLFVFLAHFVGNYLSRFESNTADLLVTVSMVASPAFITISGVMLGYLYQREGTFPELAAKLIDRGLFMFTAGHILISFAHIQHSAGILDAFYGWQYITDTIGLCVFVGPFLVRRTKPAGRIVLALFLFIFSWLAISSLHFNSWMFQFLQETTVGSIDDHPILHHGFPFLPWLSFYLFNTCVGEKIAIYQRNQDSAGISRTFLFLGCTLFLLSLILKYGLKMLHSHSWAFFSAIPSLLTSVYQKVPPSPVYFLAYGSVAYLMLLFLFRFRDWRLVESFLGVGSILGRNSLFVFILQYYVYYTLLFYLNLSYTPFWPIYFMGSATFMVGAAHLWERKRLTRLFTLGTARFWKSTEMI